MLPSDVGCAWLTDNVLSNLRLGRMGSCDEFGVNGGRQAVLL